MRNEGGFLYSGSSDYTLTLTLEGEGILVAYANWYSWVATMSWRVWPTRRA